MKSYFQLFKKVRNQAGVSAVIIAIVLPMLIGFTALAVEVGYMYVTKNELQNVADAAALAGAGYLGSIYEGLSYDEQQAHEFSRSDIVAVVQQVAFKNKAAIDEAGKKMNIVINDADVTIGTWDGSTLTAMTEQIFKLPDAVRVIALRDGSANDPILPFFARIFRIFDSDMEAVDVRADATAALTGPDKVEEGELKTPFGLSENIFYGPCTEQITFYPTADSCASWHNFFDAINAATLPAKMLGLIQGDTEDYSELGLVNGPEWLDKNFDIPDNKTPVTEITPETKIDDEFAFSGGTIASLFIGGVLGNKDNDINLHPPVVEVDEIIGSITNPAPFPALFDYFRRRDGDGDDSVWTATIPIYEDADDGCDNANNTRKIVDFGKIIVKMLTPPPEEGWKTVDVWIDCNTSFAPGRGGGGTGNIKGVIPNLVE